MRAQARLAAGHRSGLTADAFDITPEMPQVAEGKGLYRNLILGDLTRPLLLPDADHPHKDDRGLVMVSRTR